VVFSNLAGSEKLRISPKADSYVCAETVWTANQKPMNVELSRYVKRQRREETPYLDVLFFPGMIINLADDVTIATSFADLLPGNAVSRYCFLASQDSPARADHHYRLQRTSDMHCLCVVVFL
jgi:hypothetical protein